ncbi:MAG: hypothetical protein J4G05_07200 [Chlorobi bacterium]|nr:hypothetical protein [Chlorobiota bacterium]
MAKPGGYLVRDHHTESDPTWDLQEGENLIANIQEFADQYNSTSRPFVWTATAESILSKGHQIF